MQSISLLAILALIFNYILAFDVTLNQHWKLWKETNNKYYPDAEEHVRYEIFFFILRSDLELKYEIFSRGIWENNLKKVQEHNFQADLGIYTYWLGMNKYADMVNFHPIQFDKY